MASAAALAASPSDELRACAEEYWAARRADDWETMFRYWDRRLSPDSTLEDYVAWAEENEPFVVRECEIGDVLVEGRYGWVEMDVSLAMRRMPGIPARKTKRWEKWHVIDGRWIPAQGTDVEAMPEPPTVRDRGAEHRLRDRFEAAWEAMQTGDWAAYADFAADEAQREFLLAAHESGEQSQFIYLSRDIEWVEVIGDRGRVRCVVEFKLSDPNMSKAPPQHAVIVDRWIARDGEWYLDPRGPQE